MALNFENAQNAYTVFNEIKKTILPELDIRSFPEDMEKWTEEERKNPRLHQVYGWDRKSDSGWENIMFFIEKPSVDLNLMHVNILKHIWFYWILLII